MWLGVSLFYVGAVLCLNGLWMRGHIADREIWVINVFVGLVSLAIGLFSIFGPGADAHSIQGGALTLLFAFTYLWVAANRFSGADGRGLGSVLAAAGARARHRPLHRRHVHRPGRADGLAAGLSAAFRSALLIQPVDLSTGRGSGFSREWCCSRLKPLPQHPPSQAWLHA